MTLIIIRLIIPSIKTINARIFLLNQKSKYFQQLKQLEKKLYPFLLCTAAQEGSVEDLEKLRREVGSVELIFG